MRSLFVQSITILQDTFSHIYFELVRAILKDRVYFVGTFS